MYQSNDILIELAFIFLHALLFLVNYRIHKKKIMHPGVLFSFLWFGILLLRFIFSLTLLDKLFSISVPTYLIFFIGATAYSFGAFVQTTYWQKNLFQRTEKINQQISPVEISLLLRYILVVLIIIGLPFYILAAYRVFLASNYENFFIGLRTELSYGTEDMGSVKYLFPFSLVAYALSIYSLLTDRNRVNIILFRISLIAVIIYTIFFTGRTPFLFILALYVGLSAFYNKKFSIKKLSRLFIPFLIVFMLFGVIYGKGGGVENSVQENIKPAAQMTAIYMVGSLNALEWELHHQYRVSYNGNNSLRFFIKIGEQLQIFPNTKANDLIQEFVFVPYPTNVYTIYSLYIKDFGRIYAWIIVLLLGALQSFIYNKALTSKSIRFSIWYSFLLFPMLMSFFADQYFSLLSYWLQIGIFIEAILFLNKFFTGKNGRYSNRKLEQQGVSS